MKKLIILLFLSTYLVSNSYSQSPTWNKDDRNNIFDDCMSYSTKYKNTTGDQRESMCLCFLEETTKKYTKPEYEAKIEIEIKRIKEAVLLQCAKNIGLDLSTTKIEVKEEVIEKTPERTIAKPETNKVTKAGLIGK